MRLPAVLQPLDFRRLLGGQAVSAFGDWMATVALMALVLDVTGSAAAVGGVLALRLMPAVVAGPLATSAALRWDRKRTMLAMDLIRAPLVVLIPLVDQLWWIYGLAFLTEVGNLVFLPARDAALPDLVDENDLPSANGLVLISSYGNIPLGAAAFAGLHSLPAFAGGVLADRPYLIVFTLDALTYLVSFAFIRRLDLQGEPAPSADAEDEDEEPSTWAAFIAMFRLPLLRAVLPALVTVVLGIGALFSLGIVFVREVLGATNVQFGFLIAIFGVGAAGSVGWLQAAYDGHLLPVVRASVIAMGVVLAVMATLDSVWLAYVAAVPFGATAALAMVASLSYLQEELEGRRRVLGFTAFHVTFRFGMSVAAIAAGFLVGRLSAVTWPLVGQVAPASLVLLGAGVLVGAGGLLVRVRDVDRASREDTAQLVG